MYTNADKSETRIEKTGYAPVIVRKVHEDMKNVAVSTNFIGNRIKEGVVVETLLPDATVVQTFHDSY